jgi:ankyrin repeat protein
MLLAACERGDLDAVKQLLASEQLEFRNAQGYTALQIAARMGFTDIVQVLAAAGASVNAANNVTCTQ